MKKVLVLCFFSLLLTNIFSQKDLQAWKSEKTLEKQYISLKSNVSKWDGYIMIKERPLNEFHKSILDTVAGLEKEIVSANGEVAKSKLKQSTLSKQLTETQESLEASLLREKEMVTLGISVDKNTFPTIMYVIIIFVLIVSAFVFFLYFRSNSVTNETEKLNENLTQELKAQKTKALERETKLARELQNERNKNYN